MKHLGDITKLNGAEIPVVDCITGGSPCQDLSVAGKRAGLDGERSGLFMEQIRIVKEMRKKEMENGRTAESVRPRWMVWENVPGAFSSNGGKDFRAVLTEIVRIVEPECADVPMPKDGRWSKAGCLYDELGRWSVAWRVHDAQFWGVPQRRKRIALVADFGGMCAPEVLFERKGLSRNSEQGKKKGENSSRDDCSRVKGTISIDGYNQQINYDVTMPLRNKNSDSDHIPIVLESNKLICVSSSNTNMTISKSEISSPILSRSGTGGNNQPIIIVEPSKIVRKLTPIECERLQGFPDGWTDIGEWVDTKGKKHKEADSPRYKALGNSIATPFWFYLLRRISATYERPATLGSLFDGIGGFPYCWERCNGKGAAVWASEIEEFPIAVTKIRFPE